MLTASEKRILKNKIEKYEGNIEHMYLDSEGFVTIGSGHLIASEEDAQKLPLINPKTLKQATTEEIKSDFQNIKKQSFGFRASYYRQFTELILTQDEIEKLTNEHIDVFHKELKKIYSNFNYYPSNVRLALFDMIFNLGMTKLQKNWPNFNMYIKAEEWKKAAGESKRKAPVSLERNNYVKNLLLKAEEEKLRVNFFKNTL